MKIKERTIRSAFIGTFLCGLIIRREVLLVKKGRSRYDRFHMEIALLEGGIKLKGKVASIAINSSKDLTSYQAFLSLMKLEKLPKGEILMIDGAGEYEISGIKISAVGSDQDVVYTLTIDSVVVTVGTLTALEKLHSKLPESHVLVVDAVADGNPAFVSSISTNAVVFTGMFGKTVAEKVAKTGLLEMNKYQIASDKLPTEMQTVLLA